MDVQDELSVLGREQEVLAAPARSGEAPPIERRERRLDRLERRDVRRPGPLDRRRRDGPVERAAPSLDLWQLRNPRLPVGSLPSVAAGRGA
jgi:hypothetical protein